jgi:kexin
MTLWGSSLDPTKVKIYTVPLIDTLLPPVETNTATPTSTSSTKTHAKPTAHLPGDHGTAEGENDKPAFSPTPSAPSGTSTPTPDEGWFSDMSNLVSNNKWFFGAIGAVFVFGIATLVYFWRRRLARRKRGHYTSLRADDDVAMVNIERDGRRGATGPPTKELYDAFGEVDDDDEDADEETGLRGSHDRSPGGLGFHSGFLEDDGPDSAGPTHAYKDEPDLGGGSQEPKTQGETRIPDTVSGESWVHAAPELQS